MPDTADLLYIDGSSEDAFCMSHTALISTPAAGTPPASKTVTQRVFSEARTSGSAVSEIAVPGCGMYGNVYPLQDTEVRDTVDPFGTLNEKDPSDAVLTVPVSVLPPADA
jgi:hypothetical protein